MFININCFWFNNDNVFHRFFLTDHVLVRVLTSGTILTLDFIWFSIVNVSRWFWGVNRMQFYNSGKAEVLLFFVIFLILTWGCVTSLSWDNFLWFTIVFIFSLLLYNFLSLFNLKLSLFLLSMLFRAECFVVDLNCVVFETTRLMVPKKNILIWSIITLNEWQQTIKSYHPIRPVHLRLPHSLHAPFLEQNAHFLVLWLSIVFLMAETLNPWKCSSWISASSACWIRSSPWP